MVWENLAGKSLKNDYLCKAKNTIVHVMRYYNRDYY